MKGTIKIVTSRVELIEVGDIVEVGRDHWHKVSEVRVVPNNRVALGYEGGTHLTSRGALEPVRVQVTDETPARSS